MEIGEYGTHLKMARQNDIDETKERAKAYEQEDHNE